MKIAYNHPVIVLPLIQSFDDPVKTRELQENENNFKVKSIDQAKGKVVDTYR